MQPTKLKMMLAAFIAIPAEELMNAGVKAAIRLQRLVFELQGWHMVCWSCPGFDKKGAQQHSEDCT